MAIGKSHKTEARRNTNRSEGKGEQVEEGEIIVKGLIKYYCSNVNRAKRKEQQS